MKNFKSNPSPLDKLGASPFDKGDLKNFKKVKENFICENCGEKVEGDGYTDHCPKCLWGKHVDEEIPGDRKSDCGGPMRPVECIYKSGEFKIHYKCSKCRHEFWVREGKEDERRKLMELLDK